MIEYIKAVLALIGWLVTVGLTAYVWTALRVLADNSITKHKKVCDICFRDIKRWHKLYKSAQPSQHNKSSKEKS